MERERERRKGTRPSRRKGKGGDGRERYLPEKEGRKGKNEVLEGRRKR